ncbi:MAG: HAD-IIIC family phosphatase [Hydrogenoanaerobacterium sp.]
MKTFQALKKNIKQDMSSMQQARLVLIGDCATQLLSQALRGYGYEIELNLQVLDTDYNQIDAQTMDDQSELYLFNPEYILIQMCSEKLFETFCNIPLNRRCNFAVDVAEKIKNTWSQICAKSKALIFQFNFVELNENIFGNYGNKTEASFLYQLRKLNVLLMDEAQQNKRVYLIDLSALQNQLGRTVLFDEKYYCAAKMPLSLASLPYVAKQVLDVINALRGKIKKCIVLDLDNTLWGGVIGDDGMSGIQIGELGAGHAFTELQFWIRELKRRGVILTVCSKNNEDTAKEPFIKHPEMVLRLEDISMFVANWEDKASNIRYIQQTLNLGMDSFVFLDDNPFERNMVRSLIPEITVPELPEDPAQYLSYLKSLNLFETTSFSEEDELRTKQYQSEIGRTTLQKQFESVNDYLISLEMKAEIKPFELFYYPRIAQLTQRSNQFNLRTIRYTESDIAALAENEQYITLYFTLQDKFGDHGLISVVILEKQKDETLFINTWLMSCRVLKRGMEEFIVNKIIEKAKANGYYKIIGEYIKTPKNAMVEHLYDKMGFEPIGAGLYKIDTSQYVPMETYIAETI